MNKSNKIYSVFSLCVVSAAFAQAATVHQPPLSAEEKEFRMQQRRLRWAKHAAECGGWVEVASTGKVIRVVSAQSRVSQDDIAKVLDVFKSSLRLPVEWKPADVGSTDFDKLVTAANADGKCAGVIILADGAKMPRLLVAPENGWAMVNVAKLSEDNLPKEKLLRRTQQEYWRAAGMLFGCYVSMEQPCLLTLICNNQGLDNNPCVIPAVEVLPKITSTAKKLGVKPSRRVLYDRACQEGWAPAPTNDVQRRSGIRCTRCRPSR